MKLTLQLCVLLCALTLASTIPAGMAGTPAQPGGGVWLMDIKGGIGPATRDYVLRGFRRAAAHDARAIVLRLDTPGGLDAATRDINQAILASQIPVIGWVAPEGARAASAGTYILYACHLAAMAPATSVGAATPVSLGAPGAPSSPAQPPRREGEPEADRPARDRDGDAQQARRGADGESAMERKAINDAVAYLRSLAELRGRNAEFAESAVRDAATLTASQALSRQVIEIIAVDLPSLVRQANGRNVRVGQRQVRLMLDPNAITTWQPDWRAKLLGVITEPTVAYLLLLVGLYALVIEAYAPGALFPGVTGAICLLLALYALQILPVNYAGVALVVLGVGLMAAEFAMPSFGSLGIGGLIALVAGSLIMFDTDVPGYGIPGQLILGIAVASAIAFMGVIWLAARTRKRPVVTGTGELLGHVAIATCDFQGRGQVRIRGEIWQALSPSPVHRGQKVRVQAINGLVLEVVPVDESRVDVSPGGLA